MQVQDTRVHQAWHMGMDRALDKAWPERQKDKTRRQLQGPICGMIRVKES